MRSERLGLWEIPRGGGRVPYREQSQLGSTPGAAPGCLFSTNSPRLLHPPVQAPWLLPALSASESPVLASAHLADPSLTSAPTPNPEKHPLCLKMQAPPGPWQGTDVPHPRLLPAMWSFSPFSSQGTCRPPILIIMSFTIGLGTRQWVTHP